MKKIISFLIVSALCISFVFAASSAEKLYNDFSTAINNGDLNSAMKRYSELETRVEKEKSNDFFEIIICIITTVILDSFLIKYIYHSINFFKILKKIN